MSQLWVWQNARRCCFEQLLRMDSKGTVQPYLAKSYTWVDNKTLELVLRTDVVFHNGEKFTADDVKYVLTALPNPTCPASIPPASKAWTTWKCSPRIRCAST